MSAPADNLPLSPSPAEPVPAEFDLLCEGCGYSLIGLVDSNRCPECGKEFDPNDLPLARVPWLHRVRLGKRRAYWRTVWYVLRDPRGFALELCRPVRISAADARAFRWRTIRLAVLGVIIPLLIFYGTALAIEIRRALVPAEILTSIGYWGGLILTCLTGFCWVVFWLGTDLPTFIWKGLSRAPRDLAPVHYYASAPLALVPAFMVILMVVGLAALFFDQRDGGTWMLVTLLGLIVIQLTLLCRTAAICMRAATGCSRKRVAALLCYLPFHWMLIGTTAYLGAVLVFLIGLNLVES